MDKYEYRVKTEQMLEYMGQKSYKKAMEIADSIDWRKVKNAAMLCAASEIYEHNGEYKKSRDILFIAYDRSPMSRKIVYRLGILALKLNDIKEATDCYEEFVAMAPKDPNQYILRYKILKTQKAPLQQQIEALEEFKKAEYIEKWAYELAKLYHEAGMTTECLEECDDLILWFSEGKYVYQAMELKMQYKPLTPLQQEKYIHRNDVPEAAEEIVPEETAAEEAAKTVEETEENQEESTEEVPEAEDVPAEEKAVEQPTIKFEMPLSEESEEEPEAEEPVIEEAVEEEPEVEESVIEEAAEEEPETEEPVIEEAVEEEPEVEESVIEEAAEEEPETEKPVIEEAAEERVLHEQESTVPVKVEAEVQEEVLQLTARISIDEIVQGLEDKQEQNAQMIQEEQERMLREKKVQRPRREEVDSILPDDIRQLMEELEAEAAEIEMNRKRSRTERPERLTKQKEEEPAVQEEVPQEEALQEEKESEEEFLDETEFEEVDADGFEEIEEIEEIEESEGIKLGDTQAIAISAKALMNDTVVDIPEEKVETHTEPTSPFDTGFIVQGKYDLEAQSEIGLKAGLTEEQKKLFSYFVPVHGMSEQIVEVLENDRRCKTRYGTSRTANLLIVGRKGSGKTVLAVDIVKAIQKARKLKQGKVGIVTAESLNKKDISHIIEKLHGGAIIVEQASKLNKKTIAELNELMEEQTGELLVVLEEERRPLDKMLSAHPGFKKKFTSRLELPVFINDELVTFGQTYAKENGYKIDEMGILALYSRIDLMQREESVVTVADVKEIIDEAIEHAQRANLKRFMKKLFKKNKDESERIILQEQDFK